MIESQHKWRALRDVDSNFYSSLVKLPYMWSFFIQGFVLGFPAAAQPGPLQAFFLSQTLRRGWQRTLPMALAPLLSDGPIIALVLLVLTQLPAWLLTLLQFAGGCFLLYLAWGTLQSMRHPTPLRATAEASGSSGLLQATLINLLNPNPYLFWGTVGGIRLLEAWRQQPAFGVAFLLGFYLVLVGGFALFIVLFGLLGRVDDEAGRIGRFLSLLAVLALAGFGILQLVWSVQSLWTNS